jgi:hypothetical protein
VDPEGISPPGGDHRTLYGYTVAAVLSALTRPRGDTRDVEQLLDDELRPPSPA